MYDVGVWTAVTILLANTSATHMGVDLVRSGWMMLTALVMRLILPSVNTMDGEYTTVNMIRTSPLRVIMTPKLPLLHHKN